MPLPASFTRAGFVTPEQARHVGKFRRLMIASEGGSDTGKTEFLLTCPGPGLILAADRGFDAMCDNPKPPPTRRSDFGLMVIPVPTATQFVDQKGYVPYWQTFHKALLEALVIPEARSVCIDGDNHTWDLQRLAEHGKLSGVYPQTKFSGVYAARRALYFRCWDSGKIIVGTNMLRDEYKTVVDPATGLVVIDPATGEPKKERTGERVAQGFPDQEYLWQIRVRHLVKLPEWVPLLKRNTKPRWGLRITKCKANLELVGTELWGPDCTFAGLVKTVYPHIDPVEWGL